MTCGLPLPRAGGDSLIAVGRPVPRGVGAGWSSASFVETGSSTGGRVSADRVRGGGDSSSHTPALVGLVRLGVSVLEVVRCSLFFEPRAPQERFPLVGGSVGVRWLASSALPDATSLTTFPTDLERFVLRVALVHSLPSDGPSEGPSDSPSGVLAFAEAAGAPSGCALDIGRKRAGGASSSPANAAMGVVTQVPAKAAAASHDRQADFAERQNTAPAARLQSLAAGRVAGAVIGCFLRDGDVMGMTLFYARR